MPSDDLVAVERPKACSADKAINLACTEAARGVAAYKPGNNVIHRWYSSRGTMSSAALTFYDLPTAK